MKYCPDCRQERPEIEFGRNKNSRDGKQPYCLTHYKIRRKLYSKTERGKETEKARKLRFIKSGKSSQYNKLYYKKHRERILSSKSVDRITEISPCSRTETFKDGKNKPCVKTVAGKKTIILNPRPVMRRIQ